MNQKIKELWINALRSGEYKQSYHSLKTDSGYCCLGVLCDIAAKEAHLGSWVRDSFRTNTGKMVTGDLPENVITWAEVGSRNPDTKDGSLARLNDIGKSFLDIADIIEREL